MEGESADLGNPAADGDKETPDLHLEVDLKSGTVLIVVNGAVYRDPGI
ncbi:MAG: hypothetical protein AAB731_01475 [Patescibacteria group bacterium]